MENIKWRYANNDSYFKEPWAVAPFLDGYAVSDSANNVVRFIAHDRNKVQTATGQRAKGSLNGYGIGATFNRPTGLATDEAGNLYIADTGNNRIRCVWCVKPCGPDGGRCLVSETIGF